MRQRNLLTSFIITDLREAPMEMKRLVTLTKTALKRSAVFRCCCIYPKFCHFSHSPAFSLDSAISHKACLRYSDGMNDINLPCEQTLLKSID